MMASYMDCDSEVQFKEKLEEKGIKADATSEDATIRFDFRASTTATSPLGRVGEARVGDGEEQGQVKLKKLSLRSEKYNRKFDFEGWVNQFKDYAVLGQWSK